MNNDKIQQARLDAVAAVRAGLNNDEEAVQVLLNLSPDPREMARAAVGFVASLLYVQPAETRQIILDRMMAAALATQGGE